ncbi:MAG TPA: HD domain-containing phosphohydrolase [Methylomirabilota bacterium]|nr:HD domain-containing phosphohydrolase [Methylomirabilota bacterium]
MERAKRYLLENFEHIFVLVTLLSTAVVNYVVPTKLAFLNFYFLPIILAGYYLGRRRAVLGALLCALMITVYVVLFPESFHVGGAPHDVYTYIAAWAGFLILAGAVVGRLQEKLAEEVLTTAALNAELRRREQDLTDANQTLKDYGDTLEAKVRERTEELQASKHAVEAMKSKVEDTLYATMDASVVNLIIEGRMRTEKRNVAVLFSDLSGFTSYSEDRPPELVIRDLNRYLADIEPIILAYRGHIDKYMGDGTMCEFGAPIDSEAYRLQAVLAAIKMQERVAAGDYPWTMRIGIASGLAITGLVGSRRQTYTAIGDVVNLASRLEKLAAPGRTLIDRYTYEDVSRFVEASKKRDLPLREVRDVERERQLEALHEQMTGGATDAERFFRIGQLHQELNEPVEALQYFERALQLDPNHVHFKVAYAEARLRLDSNGTISIRGKRKRVEAFEIVGLRDPLADREKIPEGFYNEYRYCAQRIQVPADLLLPIEARDSRLGHSTTVAVLAYAIADVLGLSDPERMDVLRAGYLADIGMEIVPHHLLNRRGSLGGSEYETVKRHPQASERLLRTMGYQSEGVLSIIRSSHELLDGSGYPERLRGDCIPLGARIVVVADAYDALTSWRPYRDALARDAALDEIRRSCTRGIYDPKVVEALVKLLG